MRHIVVLFMLMFFIACSPDSDDNGKPLSNGAKVDIITKGGHEYVLFIDYNKGGIVHHAGCPNQNHHCN